MTETSMVCWSMALWADKKYGTLWYKDFPKIAGIIERRYVKTAGLYPHDGIRSFETTIDADIAYADELRELYNKESNCGC